MAQESERKVQMSQMEEITPELLRIKRQELGISIKALSKLASVLGWEVWE